MTSFAGGLVLLPIEINFDYVFSIVPSNQNVVIYSTVLLITFFYLIFAMFSLFMDRRDKRKMNITVLDDNHPNDNYFYELIVFTGNQNESGTQSKIKFNTK